MAAARSKASRASGVISPWLWAARASPSAVQTRASPGASLAAFCRVRAPVTMSPSAAWTRAR